MLDSSFGSPRMPTDPPLELDGMPFAQEMWIKTVAENSAIRDLDYDLLLDYCKTYEEIEQLKADRALQEEGSVIYNGLSRMIESRSVLFAKQRRLLYPDEP